MKNNFYDTSSLLLASEDIFNSEDRVIISSITLKELERIKTAANKDSEIKYAARRLLHYLNENPNKFICYPYFESLSERIKKADLELTDDTKILSCAIDCA